MAASPGGATLAAGLRDLALAADEVRAFGHTLKAVDLRAEADAGGGSAGQQHHCQAGQQTADKYELPAMASAALADIAYTPFIAPVMPEGAPAQAPLLKRTTAPPLAVQHCCFRI